MSRLIVKNLPPYATPETLRKHFEQSGGPGGTLTDIKIAHKQDGTSRRFGFVGFKSEEEASAARGWFNKTFIGSTRIFIDIVEGVKDAPAPRPNKRPRLEPSPHDKSGEESTKNTKTRKPKDSQPVEKKSQLDEYLKVMQPRNKTGPAWANDAKPLSSTVQPLPNEEDGDNDAEGVELRPIDDTISDLEWMRQRMSQRVDEAGKVFHQEDEVKGQVEELPVAEAREEPKDVILQTSRLFVRNLAFSCTDTELSTLFTPFGTVSQVHIPVDAASKQPKGVAYVTFAKPSDAIAAYEALDQKSFQGRLLHILPAVDRRPRPDEAGGHKNLKQEREARRKAVAGKEFNWSMLYMNSDAVANSIAERMNIPKSEILAPESDNAAVKLALAETHIIQETKSYLESEGVNLATFSSMKGRSDTTVLVKNIPYGTSSDTIRELFQSHGELKRALLPPAGTIAIVEFKNAIDAGHAFKAIAYRRLGNSVIYLEKAPKDMWNPEGTQTTHPTAPGTMSHAIRIAEQEEEEEGGVELSLAAGTTLFVKNLSFATTTDKLRQTFSGLENFAFARIQTKPDPKRPDGRLSMGYGFVGFKDVDSAKKAMKGMQEFVLDGHALHIKFAGRGAEGDSKTEAAASSSTTTKMIVKNVPFEATKKDIRQLFGAHGHLKSVRLPKKFDSRTRGFAFLEFTTRREAENAYATLRHTHLLGRHLVLEWAQDAEQNLDELRRKAGVGYGDGKAVPGQKRKIDMGGDKDEGDADADYD